MNKNFIYVYIILTGIWHFLVLGCPTTCTCNQQNEVTCSGGSITTIVTTLESTTTQLEIVSTTVKFLSPTDFRGITATNLQILILRNSYIETINDNTFEGLTNLIQLNLTQNSIGVLQPNAFVGLSKLQTLDLSTNSISSLADQFLPLIQLQTLDLSENSLTDISSGVFRMLTHLRTLTLNGNKLRNVQGDMLKGLGSLKRLDLRYCDLTTIPSDLFANSRILQTFDVGYNRLFSLPPSSEFIHSAPYLNTLNLEGNQIEILTPDQFSGMHLSYLNLAKNRIRELQYGIFNHLDVIELDLSENVLNGNSIHTQVFAPIALQLVRLNLAGNSLGMLPPGSLDHLYRLQILNLSMCALTQLNTDEFGRLQNLMILDLSNNRISYIPQPVLDSFNRLSQVNIEQNAWHCDCQIVPFRRWLFTSKIGNIRCSSTNSLECRNPKCSSPPLLAGQIIQLTDDNQLVCIESQHSPPMKTSLVIGIAVGCVASITILIAAIIICIRYSQGKITFACNDSQINSNEMEDKEKPTKPFHDIDVGSLDESDKSFVVRNFFQTMVPDPCDVSRGSPELSNKEMNFSCSSLNSGEYNPMGRESAV